MIAGTALEEAHERFQYEFSVTVKKYFKQHDLMSQTRVTF
jgi:hypothetical protein